MVSQMTSYNFSKLSNKIDHSIISKQTNSMDYTNTRFHNALIVKHDTEQAFNEELEKMKKGAFDLAKE